MHRITPIQRIVNLPRRRPQTWKVSDSPDSQEDENIEKSYLKKPNKNKDLK
jgi:hypothetical protein|tara:strand:- start:257 stop:409 length:153 start_codon:yes stop_codon:yes gene_type:complete